MNNLLKIILSVILLCIAPISGIILSKLCKEEIKSWIKRLYIIIIISAISCIITVFLPILNLYKIPIILTLIFVILMFLTIILKLKYL
jgi:hypothetical protein